jgi:valyl-tRNA synthetase
MELRKTFEPREIEEKWYQFWETNNLFDGEGSLKNTSRETSRAPYCIQLPPPNVTGTLHMGHAFQQTLMDCLIRYHRMEGKETNWIVGTDHAGIATQIVVERQLSAAGIDRKTLGRQDFIKKVWDWKEESGSTITKQMRRIGASANWNLASCDGHNAGYFTMDKNMSNAVTEVFLRLYDQGLIYKGNRLVNWDPKLCTAVSDLEVENTETDGSIWEICYSSESEDDFTLVVATTRPETMLGDVAIAVHPDDTRYAKFIGRLVRIPLTDRYIPVIQDEYVDPEFGTGCVKITPAHDFNDFEVGQRHGLTPINILELDGTINQNAPEKYRGLDRFAARKLILADLEQSGELIGVKPHKLKIPKSGRTGEIVEPLLTDQWFVKTEPLAKRALKVVCDGEIKFYPEHWTSTYNHWLENIQDWCISRQLWWGHRIPAWYGVNGEIFVARDEEQARQQAELAGYVGELRQDEDVLDTWFSSALVPFTSLGWPKNTSELKKYLPSSVLVTGFDIIFFWVARMIMMTLHFTDKVPFQHVYINALVRDADGQKMSKSKGNTLDPLDLIDGIKIEELIEKSTQGLMKDEHKQKIEKYLRKNFPAGIPAFGTDALRFTFTSLATFSRTLNFDLNRCEGYRNFCNKLWNATRFVLMHCENEDCGLSGHVAEECGPGGYLEFSHADRWISNELERAIASIRKGLDEYRFDLAANALYRVVWDEYCDWYLEIAKAQLVSGTESQKRATRRTLIRKLELILKLAHPFIPFITEELWLSVSKVLKSDSQSIMLEHYPESGRKDIDEDSDTQIATLKEIVTASRVLRSRMRVSPSERVPLIVSGEEMPPERLSELTRTLGKFSAVRFVQEADFPTNTSTELAAGYRITLEIQIDKTAELKTLSEQLNNAKQNLQRESAKLENQGFIAKAPTEIIEEVRQRVVDLEKNIKELDQSLRALSAN